MPPTRSHAAELESIETASRDELQALQLTRLRKTLQHVYTNVDHYRRSIDPVSGKVLPDGSGGELVFTSLTKEALPVIRYRSRDLTRLLPPTARSMRRMDKITGRSDDMLIICVVNVFPTQIEAIIVKCPELSAHYLIDVGREGNLDDMTVTVEMKADAGSMLSSERRAELTRRLQHQVKTNVGISIALRLAEPMTLERSSGKACRVIDHRKQSTASN